MKELSRQSTQHRRFFRDEKRKETTKEIKICSMWRVFLSLIIMTRFSSYVNSSTTPWNNSAAPTTTPTATRTRSIQYTYFHNLLYVSGVELVRKEQQQTAKQWAPQQKLLFFIFHFGNNNSDAILFTNVTWSQSATITTTTFCTKEVKEAEKWKSGSIKGGEKRTQSCWSQEYNGKDGRRPKPKSSKSTS